MYTKDCPCGNKLATNIPGEYKCCTCGELWQAGED